MSPARVDFLDPPAAAELVVAPAGAVRPAGLRPGRAQHEREPHERQRRQRQRAKLGFAITTGDLADNQQLNETRWFKGVLDGGRVDPFSGKPISARTPAPARHGDDRRAQRRRGRAPVHRRRRLRRLPGVPPTATAASGTRTWRRPPAARTRLPALPGPARARAAAVQAEGLKVPWYISRGNHDGLVQGNAPASNDIFRAIVAGCLKVFPTPASTRRGSRAPTRASSSALNNDPAFLAPLLRRAQGPAGPGPPDPLARSSTSEIGGAQRLPLRGRPSERAPPTATRPTTPSAAEGFRFISLDTVAEGGGPSGNIDHPQYRWLEQKLHGRAEGRPARDRLRPPHARHDEQHRATTSRRAPARRPSPAATTTRASPRRSTAAPGQEEHPRPVPRTRT